MNYNIIAFSGSLRKESYTTKLVKAFQQFAPQQMTVNYVEIGHLPFINQDLEANLPAAVLDLHETIAKADGVIFATPEYNRSYSPVLKNAIDWGSRPEGENKWKRKPVAIVGCTPYNLGAFGAQNHLRQSMMYLDMVPLQQPEFYLGKAAEKFDAAGKLTDETSIKKIIELWEAFAPLIAMHAEKK
ncbi:NADPH-dependent FMN reductase [Chitinophaga varians]|uniref:NADPH-dependent FMN reductase n=1 Tax=Chitinophaga varians TaxID=2202339 RepID=UPI00165FA5C4|nr:NAD(P)H-dependent oxidoreductase [Chitinophaga varians]MBC9913053.1 NAD(P)H-dependent oxidoreductase [Chitinophaga varians]